MKCSVCRKFVENLMIPVMPRLKEIDIEIKNLKKGKNNDID